MAHLLKLSTHVSRKRNTVEIDGKTIQLRDLDEFSLKDVEMLQKAGEDIDKILKKKKHTSTDSKKVDKHLDLFMSKVFVEIDPKIYERLGVNHKLAIADAFTKGAGARYPGLNLKNKPPKNGRIKSH